MFPFRRLAPLALAATVAACQDSSGPVAIDLAYLATRFDALGRARADAGDPSGAMMSRVTALTLRLGVRPTSVRITVDGVTEDYLALQTEHAFDEGPTDSPLPVLSARTMVAWRGVWPHRFLSITVAGDTGTFGEFWLLPFSEASPVTFELPSFGILFDRGGPAWVAAAGGARTIRLSIGQECEIPQRPPFMPALEPIACHRAVFSTRFTMTANETSMLTAAPRSRAVQMDLHDVAGVRLLYAPLPTMCPVC